MPDQLTLFPESTHSPEFATSYFQPFVYANQDHPHFTTSSLLEHETGTDSLVFDAADSEPGPETQQLPTSSTPKPPDRNRVQEGSFPQIGNKHGSDASRKRNRDSDDNNNDDDDGNSPGHGHSSGPPRKKARGGGLICPGLICPYARQCPEKYTKCLSSIYPRHRFSDLMQHIKRSHMLEEMYCPYCFDKFNAKQKMDAHTRDCDAKSDRHSFYAWEFENLRNEVSEASEVEDKWNIIRKKIPTIGSTGPTESPFVQTPYDEILNIIQRCQNDRQPVVPVPNDDPTESPLLQEPFDEIRTMVQRDQNVHQSVVPVSRDIPCLPPRQIIIEDYPRQIFPSDSDQRHPAYGSHDTPPWVTLTKEEQWDIWTQYILSKLV